jgi:hypothetical protein
VAELDNGNPEVQAWDPKLWFHYHYVIKTNSTYVSIKTRYICAYLYVDLMLPLMYIDIFKNSVYLSVVDFFLY